MGKTKVNEPIKKVINDEIYAFICDSRQNFQLLREHGLKDSIVFGIYYNDEDCKGEMIINWQTFKQMTVPQLGIYGDAFILLSDTKILEVINHLSKMPENVDAIEISKMLISLGFIDKSDIPLN